MEWRLKLENYVRVYIIKFKKFSGFTFPLELFQPYYSNCLLQGFKLTGSSDHGYINGRFYTSKKQNPLRNAIILCTFIPCLIPFNAVVVYFKRILLKNSWHCLTQKSLFSMVEYIMNIHFMVTITAFFLRQVHVYRLFYQVDFLGRLQQNVV